eukprot:g8469.t1
MTSSSYLTRRQRSYATTASHNNPHSLDCFSAAALVPGHERGTLQTSQGVTGRSRRRGSPFAALSEAYKPSRAAVFARPGGRDGGEVLGLRSSNFAWPRTVEALPTAPRHVQRQREEAAAAETEVTSLTKKPVLALLRKKKTDVNAVESRWVSSSAAAVAEVGAAQEDDAAAEPAAAIPSGVATPAAAATEATPTPTSPSSTHRRKVSWGKAAVYRFEINVSQTQSDVYSPDLHAVELAKKLAMMVRDPELRRAAMAVENCRRHSASIVRSLTSKQNGGVEGVEDACRVYNWREAAFLRETDELVRSIVVGAGEEKIWRLKANYRTARRKMEDACSD